MLRHRIHIISKSSSIQRYHSHLKTLHSGYEFGITENQFILYNLSYCMALLGRRILQLTILWVSCVLWQLECAH